jgi:hypothetical protein
VCSKLHESRLRGPLNDVSECSKPSNPASAGKPTHLRRMDPDWLANGEQLTIMRIFCEQPRDSHFVTMVGAIEGGKNIVGPWARLSRHSLGKAVLKRI